MSYENVVGNYATTGQIKYISTPAQITDSTTTTTTSSTYTSTGLTTSIIPGSASSRIKITVTGDMSALTNAIYLSQMSIFRGSTNLATTTLPAFAVLRVDIAGTRSSPVAVTYIDSPATTSSITYTVKILSSDNASSTQWNRDNLETVMILEEIV